MECLICVLSFNKTTRRCIRCTGCNFAACLACHKRFLCEGAINEPSCMSCKKVWDVDFLSESFPKTFLNDALKNHRRQQLFERELSLLPAAQLEVERLIKRKKKSKELADVREEKRIKTSELAKLRKNSPGKEKHRKKELKEEIDALSTQYIALTEELIQLKSPGVVKEKREFVRHCPNNDCRGFLSTQWKCGVCETQACPKCHEIVTDKKAHVCRPEDLETAQMLAKDSKPCPGCSAMIFKVSGCSQMWCANCGVAFDWNTLIIDRGRIHNPEYFEALASNRLPISSQRRHNALGGAGAAARREMCGGRNPPGDYVVISHVNSINRKSNAVNLFRHVMHIDRFVRQKYMRKLIDGNQDLRIKYLMQEITKEHFMRQLQLREKKNFIYSRILSTINMTTDLCFELLNDMVNVKTKHELEEVVHEIGQVFAIGDECLCKIHNMYKYEVPTLQIS